MTTKQAVLDLIQGLPDDVGIPEIMDELYIRQKIERAIRQADNGETISHEEVRARYSQCQR